MNNINELIHDAYINSIDEKLKINDKISLKSATLDAAWAKHGLGSTSSSHILSYEYSEDVPEEELREAFEHMLFVEGTDAEKGCVNGKWRTSFCSGSKNILIARIDMQDLWSVFHAVLGTTKIDDVPADTVCTVQELGYHPTLVCQGEFIPTTEITVIVELDGSKDADLGDCCKYLTGKPIIATWFPGRQLPTSSPTDCSVGDTMTAAEAKAKGWNVVSFKN